MEEIKFLEGKKIYLRPVLREDLEGSYPRWINDTSNDEFTEHAQFPHSIESLEEFAKSKWKSRSSLWLAIVERESKRHIGNIELSNIDLVHRRAEFKIIIDKAYHGKGYGTEAATLVLCHAFGVLNLHKVYLSLNSKNKPALKLYEKLGFVQEGVLRQALLKNGVWSDIIMMGILSEEFKS